MKPIERPQCFHSLRAPRSALRVSSRRAFTLLEILLALALSVVLLVAVYGAFDLYLRMTGAGNAEMVQAQIARALLKRMEVDLRSVVYRESSSGSSSLSSSSSSGDDSSSRDSSGTRSGDTSISEATSLADEGPVDPAFAFSRSMTGLVGDSHTLVLHVARSSRHGVSIGETDNVDAIPVTAGEEKAVAYFLADASAGGLAGLIGDEQRKANGGGGEIQGLARLEGNQLGIKIAEEEADEETLADDVALLAPEVADMQFRYFDGVDWFDSWDSTYSSGLPVAVEISLEIVRTGRSTPKGKSSKDPPPPTDLYQLTVAIPAAEPYVPPIE